MGEVETAEVMSAVPTSLSIVEEEAGVWVLAARVPLNDGSTGLVRLRVKPPTLLVRARVRRPLGRPANPELAVPHGTWLSDYMVRVEAVGNPMPGGGTMSMVLGGEVVSGDPA